MENRPVLILPAAKTLERSKGHGGGATVLGPGRIRQAKRLETRFSLLEQSLEKIFVQQDALGLSAETVVVFEVAGDVQRLQNAFKNLHWEWMGEFELEDKAEKDYFFTLDKKNEKDFVSKYIYATLFNHQARNQLFSFWEKFQASEQFEPGKGFTPLRDLFQQLVDVRPWGLKDRLGQWGIDQWVGYLERLPAKAPLELELWPGKPKQQEHSKKVLLDFLSEFDGKITAQCQITEIDYNAFLVEVDRDLILSSFRSDQLKESPLFQSALVQHFRPIGQANYGQSEETEEKLSRKAGFEGVPLVALLDGLPLAGHQLLEGGLIIDDPDELGEEFYQAGDHRHGTAMASLILHGDLGENLPALSKPLYVRPVMIPDPADNRKEMFYNRVLFVDLIHRAVKRIFEQNGEEPAAAPSVRIVNFSLGDENRPLHGIPSPLARLLDWLSWSYKVLFVVSSGNGSGKYPLEIPDKDFMVLSTPKKEELIFQHLAGTLLDRTLISPAETINGLTIGALHSDHSNPVPFYLDRMYVSDSLPAPYSRVGLGVERSIKPDFLVPGGKEPFETLSLGRNGTQLSSIPKPKGCGQKTAGPGPLPGQLDGIDYSRGTSNAAALTSRRAAILYEQIQSVQQGLGGKQIVRDREAVLLKAMVAHRASWGEARAVLKSHLQDQFPPRKEKEFLGRFLGFGSLADEGFLDCATDRVTLLGCGKISQDEGLQFHIPLPPECTKKEVKGMLRLTVTLAYFSPLNARHRQYKKAKVTFELLPDLKKTPERQEGDHNAVNRGTLQHEIFEFSEALSETLTIKINCMKNGMDFSEPIPFALVVTLEAKKGLDIDLYSPIRAKVENLHLQTQTRVQPQPQRVKPKF